MVVLGPDSLQFPAGRWRAAWIWPHRSTDWDGPTRRRTAAFVHTFSIDALPAHAPARLAAIGRATWYVNGHEVGRGPVRNNPQRMVWDDADIAPYLHRGPNHIAVLATCDVDETAWFMPLPDATDLRNGAIAWEANLGDAWVVSDDTWKATVLNGWSADPNLGLLKRGGEHADCRSLPDDWTVDANATASWPMARRRRANSFGNSGRSVPPSFPVGPNRGRPTTRPIPTPTRLNPVAPNSFTAGRIVVGTMVIDVEGPAGARAAVSGAEQLRPDGMPQNEAYDSSFTVVTDGTRRRIESVDLFGVHGVTVQCDEGVTVHAVEIHERLHPVAQPTTFECSDATLNRIFEIGRRTVSICSLDSYVDCPSREQRAWTGDSVVHQMVDLTTNHDWSLAAWHPVLAASPRADGMLPMAVAGEIEYTDVSIVPDWALHWIRSVHNLYRYVGDADALRPLVQVAEGVLRWFEQYCNADGLPTDVPGWVLIDWSSVYSDGANSTIAGLWGRALLDFAELAEWLGDAGRAEWARARHRALAAGFEKLWDPRRRLYVDSLVGDAQLPMASQHGQAAAIVGRLAPPDRWDRLVEVMLDEPNLVHAAFANATGPSEPGSGTELGGVYLFTGHPDPWWDTDRQIVRAQPFYRYVVHDALAEAGHAHAISRQLLDWTALLDRCPTSFGETWYGGTTCHGWSSTPTRDLVQHVLGVQPATPGFTRVRVAPNLGHLDWAEANVPSPAGDIRVRVDAGALHIDSPVPIDVAWQGRTIALPAGTHQL